MEPRCSVAAKGRFSSTLVADLVVAIGVSLRSISIPVREAYQGGSSARRTELLAVLRRGGWFGRVVDTLPADSIGASDLGAPLNPWRIPGVSGSTLAGCPVEQVALQTIPWDLRKIARHTWLTGSW